MRDLAFVCNGPLTFFLEGDLADLLTLGCAFFDPFGFTDLLAAELFADAFLNAFAAFGQFDLAGFLRQFFAGCFHDLLAFFHRFGIALLAPSDFAFGAVILKLMDDDGCGFFWLCGWF